MGTLSFFSAVLTASPLPFSCSTLDLELEAELTEALFLETAEDLFSVESFLAEAETERFYCKKKSLIFGI